MSEQEKDRFKESDDPDVEAHRNALRNDEAAETEGPGRRETDDGDDVEAHRQAT
jgi:hypothetical protein